MNPISLQTLRSRIHQCALTPEAQILATLRSTVALDEQKRLLICRQATTLVSELRRDAPVTFLQSFLTEYGLSNSEGVALMCLAEAFLRVPDTETLDRLIAEKILASNWRAHAGQASAFLVNASTWGLMLSGRILSADEDAGLANTIQRLLSRLGEPVIRIAMTEVMQHMGEHFVLGESIQQATGRARALQDAGYRFSYDMLGEAVRTEADAQRCMQAYAGAIAQLASNTGTDFRDNAGISVKLSALHPRFELAQKPHMLEILVSRVAALATTAAQHNLGFNIDAEEAERLEITLDVVEALVRRGELKGWDGFGVVVQAYSKRAGAVIDWLYALAQVHQTRLTVRLVKGAYWDTEIKRAQVLGLSDYPVYTQKAATDIAYLAAARQLLGMTDRLYPQFATHNAHTLTAVLAMAQEAGQSDFELQRLHGMGETLHQKIMQQNGTRHRIYAPVGQHRDLLAYLVRRLLENGANNSFVHQIRDHRIPVTKVAADPFLQLASHAQKVAVIPLPCELYRPRHNSSGWDLSDSAQVDALQALREPWRAYQWTGSSIIAEQMAGLRARTLGNPAQAAAVTGSVSEATDQQMSSALAAAQSYQAVWSGTAASARAALLRNSAQVLQDNCGEVLALLQREAGKTLVDAIGEWREAIDFLRYYAEIGETATRSGRGIVVCISPWNFPLAIFIGQVAAALVTGNVVIAKPAEQTPLIASAAVRWLHSAGIPVPALQLLLGDGKNVGSVLCADARVHGVCFTGSLETAQVINKSIAEKLPIDAAFIAETGGLNAMIVDSTALPEQTIRDVIQSAFNSAGQRCSALRILYLQEEIANEFITMLTGAMATLQLGDPWQLETDIGPVIDAEAAQQLRQFLSQQQCFYQCQNVPPGNFIAPSLIRVSGIEALAGEVFGPILHVATFKAAELDSVVEAINGSGYGLTFGMHSRLMERIDDCVQRLKAGNVYINRNQIGAVVGSQPFGGEGLSGTGPKAGGPHYLAALQSNARVRALEQDQTEPPALTSLSAGQLQSALGALQGSDWKGKDDRLQLLTPLCSVALREAIAGFKQRQVMPGPTGEQNHLSLHGRGITLCLGPAPEHAVQQALQALIFGGSALICCQRTAELQAALEALQRLHAPVGFIEGSVEPTVCAHLQGIDLVALHASGNGARNLKRALASRPGKIVPLVSELIAPHRYFTERLVCTDTTAAGGNVTLMAQMSPATPD